MMRRHLTGEEYVMGKHRLAEVCYVCGGVDDQLLPECPGRRLSAEEHEANERRQQDHFAKVMEEAHGFTTSARTPLEHHLVFMERLAARVEQLTETVADEPTCTARDLEVMENLKVVVDLALTYFRGRVS